MYKHKITLLATEASNHHHKFYRHLHSHNFNNSSSNKPLLFKKYLYNHKELKHQMKILRVVIVK